jgi:hypothetical protein
MAFVHLLYPDVPLYRPRLRIYLYRDDLPVGSYGADSITPAQLEVGVLNRACQHAGVSAVEHRVLRRYRAILETGTTTIHIRYNAADMEFRLIS